MRKIHKKEGKQQTGVYLGLGAASTKCCYSTKRWLTLGTNNFLRGFCSLVVRMVQEKRKERERVFWVDRNTCMKKRIATDLYYYYGEIEYKINA